MQGSLLELSPFLVLCNPPYSDYEEWIKIGMALHHATGGAAFDLWDRWARRSVGACAYHVWHPEGRAYEAPPLTRFEASARRAACAGGWRCR